MSEKKTVIGNIAIAPAHARLVYVLVYVNAEEISTQVIQA
jgi:hypothetical protein